MDITNNFSFFSRKWLSPSRTGDEQLSIEQAAKMRQVKPAFDKESQKGTGFEHVSGYSRYLFMFIVKLILWTGLVPLKMGGSTKMYEFKLFSISSLFAFVRLLIVTFPVLILPLIFIFGGFTKQEYEEQTGERFYMEFTYPGLQQLYQAEFYINFLVYVLPSAFAFVSVEHVNESYNLMVEFKNMMIMEDQPSFVNVKYVLLPIMCFLLFALGKLLNVIQIYTTMDSIHFSLYINMYTNICFFLLVHLPLHFMLAVYENYLYQSFNMFQVMCSWTLNAKDKSALLARANMLPGVMEAIQRGFGFFILVDITLMLIYWLLHLYHAYFTFQVTLSIGKICMYLNHIQDGLFPASASALIILAEFSRVFLLSDSSARYSFFTIIRVSHAYAVYAEYADYAHMRNMWMRIKNLIHIFQIQREKN